MFLGLAWAILGIANLVDNALGAWRGNAIWFALPVILLNYLLPVALSVFLLLAGAGIIAHKKWGWVIAVAMSAFLLISSVFGAVVVVFFYLKVPSMGIALAVRNFMITAFVVPLSLYTLIRFFRDRRLERLHS